MIEDKMKELKEYLFEILHSNCYYDSVMVQLLAKHYLNLANQQINPSKAMEVYGCAVFEQCILNCVENNVSGQNRTYVIKGYIEHLKNRVEFYQNLYAESKVCACHLFCNHCLCVCELNERDFHSFGGHFLFGFVFYKKMKKNEKK